jgi:hypothetical protein
LVDVADRRVVVESPLLETATAGEPAVREVWRSDFEGDIQEELGWSLGGRNSSMTRRDDPEHGQVACFTGSQDRQFPVLLGVDPLARYRITRVLRATSGAVDLEVSESSIDLKRPSRVNHPVDLERLLSGRLLAKGSTPTVHRFRSGREGVWDRATLDFATGIDSRSLVILFKPAADPGQSQAEACLAELAVQRLETTPEQAEKTISRGAAGRSRGRHRGRF